MSNEETETERANESISRQYAEATGIAVGTHVDDPDGKGLPDYEPISYPEAAEANDEAVKEREDEALKDYVTQSDNSPAKGEGDDSDPDAVPAPEGEIEHPAAESDTLVEQTSGPGNEGAPNAEAVQAEANGEGAEENDNQAPGLI